MARKKDRPLYPFADHELARMVVHVVYEVQMWRASFDLLAKASSDVARNVAIEIKVLHHRNLLKFFFTAPDERQQNDVLACDFIQPDLWVPPRPNWYEDYIWKCNKQLAHFTYDRARLETVGVPSWDFQPADQDLKGLLTDFLSRLPPDRKLWFPGGA